MPCFITSRLRVLLSYGAVCRVTHQPIRALFLTCSAPSLGAQQRAAIRPIAQLLLKSRLCKAAAAPTPSYLMDVAAFEAILGLSPVHVPSDNRTPTSLLASGVQPGEPRLPESTLRYNAASSAVQTQPDLQTQHAAPKSATGRHDYDSATRALLSVDCASGAGASTSATPGSSQPPEAQASASNVSAASTPANAPTKRPQTTLAADEIPGVDAGHLQRALTGLVRIAMCGVPRPCFAMAPARCQMRGCPSYDQSISCADA